MAKGSNVREITLADGTVRWRLKFYLGVDPETGKREFHNETFDTLSEAKDKAAKLRVSRAGGVQIRPSKETLTAFLRRWLSDVKEGEIVPRTMHDYQNVLRRYVFNPPKGTPAIGRTRLNRLHPDHFQKLYAHMRKEMGLSPRTIQYLRTILHGALDHAVGMGHLGRNPTVGAKAPKLQRQDTNGQRSPDEWKGKKKAEAMNREQALAFLEAASGERHYALWVSSAPHGPTALRSVGIDLGERRPRRGTVERPSDPHKAWGGGFGPLCLRRPTEALVRYPWGLPLFGLSRHGGRSKGRSGCFSEASTKVMGLFSRTNSARPWIKGI